MKKSIPAVFTLFFLYFRHRKAHSNKAKRALISAVIGVPIAIPGGYIINTFFLN